MKNKRGLFLIYSGVLLILAAAVLTGRNLYESTRAAMAVDRVNQQLNITAPVEDVPLYIIHPEIEMPTEEIDGHSYIGQVEVPSLGLKLPVISQWSDERLKTAPSRYAGSVYMDDMVIAGHAYKKHFGQLKKLTAGDGVVFTDMDGNRFEYTVALKEVLPPAAVEEMLSGGWDLTLFTCTTDSANRVTIRCEKIK